LSTRSNIIAHLGQDSWGRIYCHFDGYPSGVGATLQAHYTDPGKVAKLIGLGALSSLEAECDGAPGHSYTNRVDGQTVAYGRDRGETGVDATLGRTLDEVWPGDDGWGEYLYVFDGEKWSVCGARHPISDLQSLEGVLGTDNPDGALDAPVILFGVAVANHKTEVA
jgi:hypothetical protein